MCTEIMSSMWHYLETDTHTYMTKYMIPSRLTFDWDNKCVCGRSSTNVILVSCFFHSLSAANSNRRGAEPLYQNSKVTVCTSSSSDENDSIRKPLPYHTKREQRKDREPRPAAQEVLESQYETGYTTGDTGNELDQDHTAYLYRCAITLL